MANATTQQKRAAPTAIRRRTARQRRSYLPIVIVGAAVVLALVIAIVATAGSDHTTTLQTGSVTITGQSLSPLTDSATDTATGRAAPELQGASFDGTTIAIRNDGRPKVVLFVAHWCPHCRAEVPVIVRWLATNGQPVGVDLYAVSTSVSRDRPNYPPSEWLDNAQWTIPTMADTPDSQAAAAYGVNAFPFFVVINAQGNVASRVTGELDPSAITRLIETARR